MSDVTIERIGEVVCELGEGPTWDPVERALYWIDCPAARIWRHYPDSDATYSWDVPGDVIGSLALREAGGVVLAMDQGFHGFDFATGKVETVAAPLAGQDRTRFNDGKVDRQGRFVAGSLDGEFKEPLGALYRLDADGGVEEIDGGFIVSNGPCFSPDGRVFYHCETRAVTIFAYDYDTETGQVSNKGPFASIKDLGIEGRPDGATVDAEGYVWTALITGGQLARFSADGALDRLVEVPVRYVTSLCFGGPDLDVVYITSIGGPLFGASDESPGAGGVFAIHGLGVQGLAEPRFRG
jgi:sugar lactone lactonase YvrE